MGVVPDWVTAAVGRGAQRQYLGVLAMPDPCVEAARLVCPFRKLQACRSKVGSRDGKPLCSSLSFLCPPPQPPRAPSHLMSPGAVTTRLRKMWQQVCKPISTLSGSTEVSCPGDVSSHCCRKYLQRSEGAPSLIRISRGPSSTVRWHQPGRRSLWGRGGAHDVG